MEASDEALARSRVYHLLGKLFLYGVTGETLDYVRAVAPLAGALTRWTPEPLDSRTPATPDLDEAAADYQHVFGFNVFAFQSAFLDPTAQPGSVQTERVSDAYLDAGFPLVKTGESADHVGVELNFLGFLSRMEAEHTGRDVERARQIARTFLDEHLLGWLTPLTVAIERQSHPFFDALAALTREVVCDHRRALGDPVDTSFALADAPDILDNPKTGLRDIARYLLTPVHSGLYLSRDDIRALSHAGELPAGFGARRTMLNNLLRSAADYDGMADVVAGLRALIDQMRQAHRAFADTCPAPADHISQAWLARLDKTEAMMARIGEAA